MVPAVVVAVLVTAYALVRAPTWEASQALIVRDEAAAGHDSPGKFRHNDEMKSVQETIVELLKSRQVLAAALAEVGPPKGPRPVEAWPGGRAVAALRDAIKISPPGGAEFGTTEVFHLSVRDRDRDRAVALVEALCAQLEGRFQDLRDSRAQSMIDELAKAATVAHDDLADATGRLTEIETLVGSDLAELRNLQESGGGDSALRRTITEIRNELRQAQAAGKSNEDLLALLRSAQADPSRLLATPNRLFESQPALKRLKDALVDAQIRTAELLGRMSDEHPVVQAARVSEQEIGRHLHNELATAVRGVELDLRLTAERAQMLEARLAEATARLDRLAALRATYANQVAETRNRTELLKRAEEKLADARVSQASAKAASLIARIDAPDAGTHPVGPSRAMIVLVGVVGGLLSGLGMFVLSVDLTPTAPVVPTANGHAGPAVADRCGNGHVLPKKEPVDVLSLKEALRQAATVPRNGN
jgi:uncharacterized protein involved in exopolysaccharide biosynthesis